MAAESTPAKMRLNGHESVLKWELENRAYVNARDAKRQEKSKSAESVLEEVLAPLREKYNRLPYPHRQGFLAAVIYHITK